MKKILGWLCIVSILLTSMVAGTTIVSAATPSTATVTDVYASGNWTVGQTVTAHFTYYDPTGKPQVGDAQIQWYRNKMSAAGETAIPGATSANYTITADDTAYSLYFTVTVSNADGAGKTFYSPIYQSPKAADAAATAPTRLRGHMVLMGGATEFVPGATVRAVGQAAFTNGKAPGQYSYLWRVRDTKTSNSNTNRAYTETYTIQEEDYGKWLECVITPKDEDGVSNGALYVPVKIGTKFGLDSELLTGSGFYRNPNSTNLINRIWYQQSDQLYSYGGTTIVNLTVDTKKAVKFDGFYFNANRVKTDFDVSYSLDNVTWHDFTPAVVTTEGNVDAEYESNTVYTARYFRITFGVTGNCTVNYAFPYLSAANRSAEYIDIDSVGYGAEANNGTLAITNITYGTPLKTLADSVVAVNDESVVSVTDAIGAAVATENITLTDANVANYRIKVANGDHNQSYALELAGNVFENDFSGMVEGKKYMNNKLAGQTRDIPGGVCYWDENGTTPETSAYGIRESIGNGEYAMKVVNNGAVVKPEGKDAAIVQFWSTATNLDPTGCYSLTYRIKADDNTSIGLHCRAGSRSSAYFDRASFRMNVGEGLFVSDGSKHARVADFESNQWYNIELVIDYNDNSQSIWINGVNYGMDIPFNVNSGTVDKTQLSYDIILWDAVGNTTDESYIADFQVRKVWDVATKVSADGEALGMKLYNGDAVVNSLAAGTYTAKGNGNIFSDDYYVAVYKVTYADDAEEVMTGCSLINAYCISGSGTAQINNIEVPAAAYENYPSGNKKSEAIVKIFCFNDGLKPARDFLQID